MYINIHSVRRGLSKVCVGVCGCVRACMCVWGGEGGGGSEAIFGHFFGKKVAEKTVWSQKCMGLNPPHSPTASGTLTYFSGIFYP